MTRKELDGQGLGANRIAKSVDYMGALLTEADQLRLFNRAKAFPKRCEVNSLQQIGLALGVVTVEKVDPSVKVTDADSILRKFRMSMP